MKLISIKLSAFGEGGEGAAAPAAAQGSNAAPAQPQSGIAPGAQAQKGAAPSAGRARSGTGRPGPGQAPNSGQAPEGAQASGDGQQQAQRPSFDELIRGEYRQEYDRRVQEFVNRRLQNKNAELDAVRPIMAILQQRYGIEDGKGAAGAVLDALRRDDAYWESAAEKAGMTAEQYRQIVTVEARNRELQAILAAQQTEQRRNETYRRLTAEAEQVRAMYPDFDVEAELRSGSRFGDLIRSGVDMLTAYQVCHQRDFLAAAQQQAAARVADSVRANQSRPAENGSGGGQAAKPVFDPSKLTKAQRRDIERRVRNGERITFQGGTF